jgi:DNA-binding FrmR family transcriptional regulator
MVHNPMANISRQQLKLINRSRKVVGQFELVQRALEKNEAPTEVLRRLSAARNWANALMADLLEDHILNRVTSDPKPPEETADQILDIVRTYLR